MTRIAPGESQVKTRTPPVPTELRRARAATRLKRPGCGARVRNGRGTATGLTAYRVANTGVAIIFQVLPFHSSARVCRVPDTVR